MTAMHAPPTPPAIPNADTPLLLLFDGDCGWCLGWARWLAPRADGIAFAPLSGPTARGFLTAIPTDTLVVIQYRKNAPAEILTHARAVLRVMDRMGGRWSLAATLGRRLPGQLADWLYRRVARNRHRLSGPGALFGLGGAPTPGDPARPPIWLP